MFAVRPEEAIVSVQDAASLGLINSMFLIKLKPGGFSGQLPWEAIFGFWVMSFVNKKKMATLLAMDHRKGPN